MFTDRITESILVLCGEIATLCSFKLGVSIVGESGSRAKRRGRVGLTWTTVVFNTSVLSFIAFGDPLLLAVRLVEGVGFLDLPWSREGRLSSTIMGEPGSSSPLFPRKASCRDSGYLTLSTSPWSSLSAVLRLCSWIRAAP